MEDEACSNRIIEAAIFPLPLARGLATLLDISLCRQANFFPLYPLSEDTALYGCWLLQASDLAQDPP